MVSGHSSPCPGRHRRFARRCIVMTGRRAASSRRSDKTGAACPMLVGKDADGHCVSVRILRLPQSWATTTAYELGPREIVQAWTPDGYRGPSTRPASEDEDLRVSVGVLRLSQFQLRRHERRGHALPQRRHHGARRGQTGHGARRGLRGGRAGFGRAARYRVLVRMPCAFREALHQSTRPRGRVRSCRRTRTCATAWRR